MPDFKLFPYIDTALVEQESRDAKASTVPAVWPSEASSIRIDQSVSKIVGACHRKSFMRMLGFPVTNQIDPVGAWRWVTGRLMEGTLVDLAKTSKIPIYIANGVRHFVPEFYLPLELDLVVLDPKTNKGWITECKTYYGYMAKKEIEGGKPKLENLMQAVLYLMVVKDGATLKQIIADGLANKGNHPRNRIEANLEMVQKMDDGPVGAKLVYISRDECLRKEFTVGIAEDFDGSHYPTVDGELWKIFTIESIYERFRTLQNYWFRARQETVRRLTDKGINPPESLKLVLAAGDVTERYSGADKPADERKAEDKYMELLADEARKLPESFWPPAEYQWAYTPEKVELLASKGEIGKARYKAWKDRKSGKDRIGDWQCLYCNFKSLCVPKQNPNWAYQLYDIENMEPDVEAA